MTRDVLVSVKGTQIIGDESDTIEVITAGTFYDRDGKSYILYEETVEGMEETTHNTVKAWPGMVEVTKKGAAKCRMVFECGKKHMSNYFTPMGLIVLGITTSALEMERDEDVVRIHIEYALEMNGEYVSNCRLELAACSRKEGVLNLNET